MKSFFEITTNNNRRPGFPADNTVIIGANDMAEALQLYHANAGKLNVMGEVLECKKVHYVYTELTLKQ